MGERLEILEFKRRLNTNKDKFKNQLQFVCDLFSVDGDKYIKRYGYLGEEMVDTFIKMEELKHKLNDLDYKCENLKTELIVDNNIDIKERIKDMVGRERILDELYRGGFLSSDLWEVIKTFFWNDRSKVKYELPQWKQFLVYNYR